jgi:acetylornithine deacetylase/succinyl-diaminopimelate desuccinylase-like protein
MNALPQLAAATVNCRVLPEESVEYVEGKLGKVISDEQVAIHIIGEVTKGPASPMRPDLLKASIVSPIRCGRAFRQFRPW